MLNRIRPLVSGIFTKGARVLAKLGFTPNVVTLVGLGLSVVAALLILERLYLGGALAVALSGLVDGFDGALARLTNTQTEFGGVLDSVADRYGDALIMGSAWIGLGLPDVVGLTALVGSLLTSYTRARLEAAGSKSIGSIGLVERPERLVLMIVCLVFVRIALYVFVVIAILSNFTVVQRLIYGRKRLSGKRQQTF